MEITQTTGIATERDGLRRWTEVFLRTEDSTALLVGRVALGIVMLPHGAQKLLGWFGGHGFTGTMDFFTDTMKLPWLIGFLVIVIEFFGGLALVAGAAGRLFAVGTAAIMLGAIATTHLEHGFFMNWYGHQPGEGFEFHLLAIGLSLAIAIAGSGRWSVDRLVRTGPR